MVVGSVVPSSSIVCSVVVGGLVVIVSSVVVASVVLSSSIPCSVVGGGVIVGSLLVGVFSSIAWSLDI